MKQQKHFADAVADQIRRDMHAMQPGVMLIRSPSGGQPLVAIFGNDGYHQVETTRRYVDEIAAVMTAAGAAREIGVDSAAGSTWAIVFRIPGGRPPRSAVALARRVLYLFQSGGGAAPATRSKAGLRRPSLVSDTPLTIAAWANAN